MFLIHADFFQAKKVMIDIDKQCGSDFAFDFETRGIECLGKERGDLDYPPPNKVTRLPQAAYLKYIAPSQRMLLNEVLVLRRFC